MLIQGLLHTLDSAFGILGRFERLGSGWDRRRASTLAAERLHVFQKLIEFGDEQGEPPMVLLLRILGEAEQGEGRGFSYHRFSYDPQ